jgi:hypothetical protein
MEVGVGVGFYNGMDFLGEWNLWIWGIFGGVGWLEVV